MEASLKIVGEYGNYQNHIKVILLSCAFLTDIYSLQIGLMLKLPKLNIIEKSNKINYNNHINNPFLNIFLYSNITSIDKIFCNKNKYSIEFDNTTILKNWNYDYKFFCDNEWNNFAIIISIIIGTIFGLIFFSPLPDRIGREKILKYSLIFSCFLHLNLFFCLNNFHLIIINFFGGLNNFVYVLSFICITEYLPNESNGINIGIFNTMNPIYGILLYLFLVIFKDWRIFFFCTSIANIFCAGYTWKYFLESPRWLYSIGQKIKCISILDKISLYNGTLAKWNEYQNINIENANRFGRASANFTKLFNFEIEPGELDNDLKGITIFDIFNFKSQIKTIIILSILCFMSSFSLNGIIFIIFKKSKDFIYIYILLLLSRIIIGMITGYLCDIIGRKPIIMFGGLIGTIVYYIFTENNSDIFLMISLFCFEAINIVLYIYIPENIPTPIRSSLSGWLFIIYRMCPLFIEIYYKLSNINIINYSILLSGFCCGLCVLNMKESLGANIPDIIPELKDKIESLENINLKSFHSTEYPSFLI